ncbi:methionyl-tRNA formyltransferase [Sediminicurvatus halobius]|uniref:Methionyl-tRNA formyltransferase n=1 Tax=Sediminicurvatus halobius TaxID=2182432 RepID=A0A2U2MZI8_9GAMM|nr:methionyl-tRNA formyltransferase [Spiribacter halobius]PWG62232.1 methionyl-tRNA formyltransferase [Spiribacter halobius]UEX78141.1 methionyl-tRNA formyltransferase [Spiribacter halobius]
MAAPPRVVFAGTPAYAVPALQRLLDGVAEVCAVYTQPDRPAGRGRRLLPSPVKQAAEQAGVPVEQPERLRDSQVRERLAAYAPDVMVVAAYGLILPPKVLAIPRRGCLNLHASLLPRWRGAAPIQRAILAGDERTGVCLMQMEKGLDTGPVVACRETPITGDDTAGTLHDRLARLGAELLAAHLADWCAGRLAATPQPESGVTYAEKIDPAEAWIDWSQPAAALARQVRAFEPWPVARTRRGDGELRLRMARALPAPADAPPGTVLAATADGLDVATGEGVLRITQLQAPGRRAQPVAEFLRGHRIGAGERLG